MLLTDALHTRKVYNKINKRRISHVKSQPITKKHFAQEYKIFRANQ